MCKKLQKSNTPQYNKLTKAGKAKIKYKELILKSKKFDFSTIIPTKEQWEAIGVDEKWASEIKYDLVVLYDIASADDSTIVFEQNNPTYNWFILSDEGTRLIGISVNADYLNIDYLHTPEYETNLTKSGYPYYMTLAEVRRKLMKLKQEHPDLTLPPLCGKSITTKVLQEAYDNLVQEIQDNNIEIVETITIPGGTYAHTFDITGRHEYIKKIVIKEVTLPDLKISNGPITRKKWQAVAEASNGNLPLNTWLPLTQDLDPNGWVDGGLTYRESEEFKSSINDMTKPAVGMTWLEADAFCKELSKLTGKTYTLPTEAQLTYCNISVYYGIKDFGGVDQMCSDWYTDDPNKKFAAFPTDGTAPSYTDNIYEDIRVVMECNVFNCKTKPNESCMSLEGDHPHLGFHVVCLD